MQTEAQTPTPQLPGLSGDALDAVVNAIPDGVTVLDERGRFLAANDQAARLLGFEDRSQLLSARPGELMARFEIFDEKGAVFDVAQLPSRSALAGVQAAPVTLRFRDRGTRHDRWSVVKATPMTLPDGRRAAVSTWQDITEQKRREEDAHFLAEASRVLGMSLDVGSTLSTVARLAVPKFADWCAVDIVVDGKPVRVETAHIDAEKIRFVHDLGRRYPSDPDASTGVPQILRTGKAEMMTLIPAELIERAAVDAEHLRLIRELAMRSYMGVPLTARGRTLGVITFVSTDESGRRYTPADLELAEDLGRRAGLAVDNAMLHRDSENARRDLANANTQLEARVEERTRALIESNRELESFSYSVSHDLRAPIRHITGFAQLVERRAANLDPEIQRHLKVIREAAVQAGQLVDDLLAFSRMGRAEMRQSSVDLSALVESLRQEVERESGTTRAQWDIGPLPIVTGDPAMVRLVVKNLLQNAVKFSRNAAEPRVTVRATTESGEHVLSIADNGAGFDMRYVDKLFGVFQRLHRAEEFEGTGIGLASVRRIVNRHGGRVWAEGRPGEGATFFISLPATERA